MDQFQLRLATQNDIESIAHVFIESRTECLAFLNQTYSLEVMREVFAREIGHLETWVGTLDEEIVGFICFSTAEVDHLYILPNCHRMGLGSGLLEKALDQPFEELRLWVFQENHQARRFYESRGFVLEFKTDGQDNMEKTPDARYVLTAANCAPADK